MRQPDKNMFLRWKEKIRNTGQEFLFWLKGMDAEEDIVRVIRVGCVLGGTLLIISLTGLTIHYVVRMVDQPEKTKQKQITVESKKDNHMLEEQYASLVNQVEELNRRNKNNATENLQILTEDMVLEKIQEQIKINVKSGKNGMDGKQGETGMQGKAGHDGEDGEDGKDGRDGIDGKNGKSAYEQAVDAGFEGSEEDFARILSHVDGNLKDMDQKLMKEQESLLNTQTALETTNSQVTDLLERFNQHNEEMLQKVSDMQANFQDGCNVISAVITAQGVDTPVDSTPNTMAENIQKLSELQYSKGITDGMLQALENVEVEYEYHYHDGDSTNGGACFGEAKYHTHTSNCYRVCPNKRLVYYGEHRDGNGKKHYDYICNTCGYTTQPWFSCGDSYEEVHTSKNPSCGYANGEFLGYEKTCGYEEGQIISAKIIY